LLLSLCTGIKGDLHGTTQRMQSTGSNIVSVTVKSAKMVIRPGVVRRLSAMIILILSLIYTTAVCSGFAWIHVV